MKRYLFIFVLLIGQAQSSSCFVQDALPNVLNYGSDFSTRDVMPITDSEPILIMKPEQPPTTGKRSGSQARTTHRSARRVVCAVTAGAGFGVAA
jgi:hypothetical protein